MKKKQIKINDHIAIDRDILLQTRMVILANSGAGKSYLVRKFAEEAVKNTQVIIIDPEGEFASLRDKYDFILGGKNADVPIEVRSAALLAIKLLELEKSAILDLYELHPQERQQFVKNFCAALINCPKSLYHPVFVILDEAHAYAPEGKPSEATTAVENLASLGRKRGQCLIPASQRIAKISKNVTAECNNKLIGRASQDIDMKRAGDELGFNKDRLVELRQLKPGEFFAFGPAISDEIIKLKVGEVKTTHAKAVYKAGNKIPPPSDVIKRVLKELKDLPQEAEKELKTVAEFKAKIKLLERDLKQSKPETVVDEYAIKEAVLNVQKQFTETERKNEKKYKEILSLLEKIRSIIPQDFPVFEKIENGNPIVLNSKSIDLHIHQMEKVLKNNDIKILDNGLIGEMQSYTYDGQINIGKCGRAIYSYLVMRQGSSLTKTQIAVATGYSVNSGGFNNAISELAQANLISRGHNLISLNGAVNTDLVIEIDTTLHKWLPKLGACARKIFQFLLDNTPEGETEAFSKDRIAEETNYSVTSGGFNNSISELSSLGLVTRIPNAVMINNEIIEL